MMSFRVGIHLCGNILSDAPIWTGTLSRKIARSYVGACFKLAPPRLPPVAVWLWRSFRIMGCQGATDDELSSISIPEHSDPSRLYFFDMAAAPY